MARGINLLSQKDMQKATAPGRYGDGGGLYLVVSRGGTRSWVFMAVRGGKRSELGLGSLLDVSVTEARAKAAAIQSEVKRGVDPEAARDGLRRGAGAPQQGRTFKDVAEAYIEAHRPGWRSAKHAGHWTATLEAYAYPLIGSMDVAAIGVDDVLACLRDVWTRAPETASRVRGRIEAVLGAAKARKLRSGENPAGWKDNLDHLLHKRVERVQHREAMPWADVPCFYRTLAGSDAPSAAALRLIILTAARSREVTGMKWSEVDLEAALWTVPAERMKGGRPHSVPLSPAAVDLLRSIKRRAGNDHVFVGYVRGEPLSEGTVLQFFRRFGQAGVTVHGFRSSFRDWIADQTDYPGEVAEAALAHANGDKVEASYRRTTFMEKRRDLMAAWAAYCTNHNKEA